MTCDEAMNRSAGRALGELEAAEQRELEAHLAGCSECRANAAAMRDAVNAMKSDAVEAWESRRERVVAAMKAARPSRSLPRRRWIAAAVAAALLVALTVTMLVGRGGLAVNRMDGSAWIQRAGSHEYVALRPGDRLGAGDWLKTESVVGLEGQGLNILVNRNSRIAFDGQRRIVHLAEGAIFVESPEREVTIDDPSERRAVIRDGRAEIRLPIVASGTGDKKTEMVVLVDKGAVRIQGAKESREASPGETWSVDGTGAIRIEKPGIPAPWRKQQ